MFAIFFFLFGVVPGIEPSSTTEQYLKKPFSFVVLRQNGFKPPAAILLPQLLYVHKLFKNI